MTAVRSREPLIALDLLRFAAALLVVRFHYYAMWFHQPGEVVARLMRGVTANEALDPVAGSGWVGVQIFFVLSGYVIAASAGRGSASDFAWRRGLRLWPAAALCTTITATVLLAHGIDPQILVAPALASAILSPFGPLIDPSYWTLGIECSFYALVAILMATGRWRPLALATCLAIASGLFWAVAGGLKFGGMTPHNRFEELSLLRFGALFALGLMIHLRHGGVAVPRVTVALALFGAGMSVVFTALASAQQGFTPFAASAVAIFTGGVAVIVFAPRLQRPLQRLGLASAATRIGLATYPLYLLHLMVGLALIGDLARAGVAAPVAQAVAVTAMMALALVIAGSVEPGLRRWLTRWRADRRGTQAATIPCPSPR
jgi:peptidoglycan/LPS O-acetylase OafA/YrhL